MQLLELMTVIRDEVNKDTNALPDNALRDKIKLAFKHIETEEDWVYMRQSLDFNIDISASNPERITIPTSLKNIESIYIIETEDSTQVNYYIEETIPNKIHTIPEGRPRRYWKESMDYIYWDTKPDKNYQGKIIGQVFTTWSDDDTFEPYLFRIAPSYIMYQTLIFLAPYLREYEMLATYSEIFQLSRTAALRTNTEAELSNQRIQMEYK